MLKCLIILLLSLSCNKYQDNQINLVLPGDPKSLDPIYASDVRSGQICALLYDNLIRFGDSTNIVPSIASKWYVSDDGKRYTFKLKNNIIFENGKKLTSKDIKKSFLRILNKDNLSSFDWIFENVKGYKKYINGQKNIVEGFVTPNDSIFIIEMNQEQNSFLYYLAMPPTSIVNIENKEIFGSGPWILKNRILDGHLLFERNTNYNETVSKIENLKIRILPENLPRVAEFLTGYLDIMEIPENEYVLWKEKEEHKKLIYLKNELNTFYLGLNCSKYPFSDKKIRKAVNYAIDKKSIIDNILNGLASIASGPIPPGLLDKPTNQKYKYNIEKAKQLLKEANVRETIEIDLWQSKSQKNSLITEVIQSQLSAIDIKVNIIRRDWNMFTQAIRENKPDMYYRSWYADYPDAENFISPLFNSSITQKRWNRYKNEEIDQLIKQIKIESDAIQRKELIEEANHIIIEDAPWVFLWHSQTAYIKNKRIKNWYPKTMYNAEKYNNIIK